MTSATTHTIIRIALPVILNRLFDYTLPKHMPVPNIGARVLVPFGPRKLVGIVVEYTDKTDIPLQKLKPLVKIIDDQPLFSKHQWQWLLWASQYYHYPLGEILMSCLPTMLRDGKAVDDLNQKQLLYSITDIGLEQLKNVSWVNKAKKLAPILAVFESNPTMSLHDLKSQAINKSDLTALVKKSWLATKESALMLKTIEPTFIDSVFNLTDEQQQALDLLLNQKGYSCTVLEGVTGSGKTEVYLQCVIHYLKQNKQVLWLEPEIGLTPQMINQIKKRINVPVFIWHSKITDKEKSQTWYHIKHCQNACLILGTRSAIFTPIQHLSLIIMDESHDSSYQQHSHWQYCARNLSVKLAHLLDIPIILGTATPSLATYFNIQQKRYQHIQMRHRIQSQPLPEFIWVDTRDEKLQHGLSEQTLQNIEETLKNNKQVLVFINRRGFCHLLRCHHCGFIHECEHCDLPMVWYKKSNHMQCHHCGHKEKRLTVCPDCKQSELSELGLGTEQLEDFLKDYFNQYPVLRVDRDHIKTQKQFQSILDDIATEKPMILIGTQMLAKGHHFKSLATVVIVNMDAAFFSSDYSACETMGQLLLQVAGRAGREGDQGKVVLQTEHKDHPLLQALVHDHYFEFCDLLLHQRQLALLPPYTHLAYIMVEGKQTSVLIDYLAHLKQYLISFSQQLDIKIIGPLPNFLAKKAGKYRFELVIQANSRSDRHQILDALQQWKPLNTHKKQHIMIRLEG